MEGDFFEFRARPNVGIIPVTNVGRPLAFKAVERRYGARLKAHVGVINGAVEKWIYYPKTAYDAIGRGMLACAEKDALFMARLEREGKEKARKLLSFCSRELVPGKLRGASGKKLRSLYRKYLGLYEDFGLVVVPPMLCLSQELEARLMGELRAKAGGGVNEAFALLSTALEDSFSARQEKGLAALASEAMENRGLREAFLGEKGGALVQKLRESFPAFHSRLEKCSDEFGWIPFNYVGPETWGAGHFAGEISDIVRRGAVKKFLPARVVKKRQDALARRLGLDKETRRLFTALQKTITITDYKKEICTKSHVFLQRALFPRISEETGIPARLLTVALPEEVEKALAGGKPPSLKELERRSTACVAFGGEKITVLSGERAEPYIRLFFAEGAAGGEVRGVCASVGKTTGAVRVILHPRDVGKIRAGEILVATMTTPDFVPAMKKAAAIVTDEGGVTCHAAIVSRELGIPCVIGTRSATRAFRDGDIVEVDASNGVVKKFVKKIVKKQG